MKTKSRFTCPSCKNPLQMKCELDRKPAVIVWCGNSRCPSDFATNDGGTGDTEEVAYRSLLLAVKHEEDKADERIDEVMTPEDKKDRDAWAVAEHADDIAKAGGV